MTSACVPASFQVAYSIVLDDLESSDYGYRLCGARPKNAEIDIS